MCSCTSTVGQFKSFCSIKINIKQIRGKLSITVLQEKIKYHIYKNNDGKNKDIELLFRQHYRPLCLFALHLINNVASAEDIVMDCYLKLWAKWKEEEIKIQKVIYT